MQYRYMKHKGIKTEGTIAGQFGEYLVSLLEGR
jgi:hypothetical protein